MNRRISRRNLSQALAAKIIAEPSRYRHWMQAAAAYLVENGRSDEASLLVNDISHELFRQKGILLCAVTSALPLTESMRKKITQKLKHMTGAAEVILDCHIDSSVLGGFIARTTDEIFDVSIKSKLNALSYIGEQTD